MRNKTLNLFLVLIMGMTFTSCIKNNINPLEDGIGSSFLKITQAPENKLFFSPFSDVKTIPLITVRRDVASSSEINTAMTVKIEVNADSVKSYNTSHKTAFEVLPDSLFTLGAGVTRSGNIFTMTLAPGEFEKDFNILMNGAKWNLSKVYALAFKVVDSSGMKISSGAKEAITLLAIKNKYDGVYEITGTFSDATNAAFTGAYPLEWELRTSGPNQCIVYDQVELGFPGFLFSTGSGLSYFGGFGLIVNFDPATDKITSVTNFYGQPSSNGRSAELDPSGVNAYNSSTKTIKIKYFLKQPSAVAAPPNIRGHFDETWKYVKSR